MIFPTLCRTPFVLIILIACCISASAEQINNDNDRNPLTKCIRRSVCNAEPTAFFACIESALPPTETIRFVQVGANDGKMLDPLHPVQMSSLERGRRWHGVFVEPVERMMDALKANKAQLDETHFLRAVVTPTCVNGSVDFFQQDSSGPPMHVHFQGMGSIVKPRRAPERFKRVSLPCVRTPELAAIVIQYGARNPHILVVDIEGHDISFLLTLEQWPFGKPLVIAFEVWEAPGKLPAFQIQHMFKFLNAHGYLVLKCGSSENYIALQQMDWMH
jgi:hypothetical protein